MGNPHYDLLNRLIHEKDSKWIKSIDKSMISPHMLVTILGMSRRYLKYAKILDDYTYHVEPKDFLYIAWTILPKSNQLIFIKYLKEKKIESEFDDILQRARLLLKMSTSDFNKNKDVMLQTIKKDKKLWLQKLGMDKKDYKTLGIDADAIYEGGIKEGKKGLDLWFS